MTDLASAELTADGARGLERAFLSGLNDAQDAYERIVAAEAWKLLGHDTFAGWWTNVVQPVMRALSMRPTREIAAAVVDQVRAEEAVLPSAQRRTQRELADMVGVHPDTVSGRKRQDQDKAEAPPTHDLDNSSGRRAGPQTLAPVTEAAASAGDPVIASAPVGHYRNRPQDPDVEERRQRLVATHQLCEVVVAVAQMRGFDTGWKYDAAMALPGRAVTTEVLTDARQAIDELLKIWDERGMQ